MTEPGKSGAACTHLVLLPGMDGTGSLFKDFVTALGPKCRAIAVSYPPDRPLDYAGLEAFARSHLPENEPYWLLAESFSGPIGISIAASAPASLRGLILCCTFARNPLPWMAFARPLISFMPIKRVSIALLSHFLMGRFGNAGLRASLATALGSVSPAALRARARAVLSVDKSADLARIEIPMLYLQAAEDRVVPSACGGHIAALARRLQTETFQAPHFLLQTLPAETAARISGLIQSAN